MVGKSGSAGIEVPITADGDDSLGALRSAIRAFFGEEYPQDLLTRLAAHEALERADHLRSQAALAARGWGAPHWPAAHGGPSWTLNERRLFEDEYVRAGAPTVVPMGLIYVAPIIIPLVVPSNKSAGCPISSRDAVSGHRGIPNRTPDRI